MRGDRPHSQTPDVRRTLATISVLGCGGQRRCEFDSHYVHARIDQCPGGLTSPRTNLGHQLVRETNGHRHPHILGCCDDRENPRIDQREKLRSRSGKPLACRSLHGPVLRGAAGLDVHDARARLRTRPVAHAARRREDVHRLKGDRAVGQVKMQTTGKHQEDLIGFFVDVLGCPVGRTLPGRT